MTDSSGQILITGCYRAGTEYITNLIGNQPRLAASMYAVNYFRYSYGQFEPVSEKANYTELLFDAAQRIRVRWDLELDPHRLVDICEEADNVTDAMLYDLMMSELFLEEGEDIWAEKNQLVWRKIPTFLEMFPNGKAIHIFRDPRSILASFREFTYTEKPAYLSAVFNTLDSMKKGLKYQRELSSEQYHQVNYENIVTKPQETLTDIFDFLQLSHTHDLLNEEGWTKPDGNPWHSNTAFDGKKETFDKRSAIERWKGNLEVWELALCEEVNGEIMREYGYDPGQKEVGWTEFTKPLFEDETLTQYLQRWALTGQGVEAFPTDPLKPDNWPENRE